MSFMLNGIICVYIYVYIHIMPFGYLLEEYTLFILSRTFKKTQCFQKTEVEREPEKERARFIKL